MSAAVISLTDSTKRFVLANSIITRPIDLGTWTTVRLGMLYDANAAGTIPSLDCAIGFCSGTSAVYGDASATHFVGMRTPGTTNWSDNGSFHSAGGGMYPSKMVGSTKTNGTQLFTSFQCGSIADSSTQSSMSIVELTYGSPNYSIRAFHRSGWSGVDIAQADFYDAMAATSPSYSNHTYASAQTLAVDEVADGTLNAGQVFFAPTSGTNFHVLDIAFARIA